MLESENSCFSKGKMFFAAVVIAGLHWAFVLGAPPLDNRVAYRVRDAKVVREFDEVKRCPPEFRSLGKDCVKLITREAIHVCAEPAILTEDNTCAISTPKMAECPEDYTPRGDVCMNRRTVRPEVVCPEEYTLGPRGDECFRMVQGPPKKTCPAESERRGDTCIVERTEEPDLVCLPGFTEREGKCRLEELYNCTPHEGHHDHDHDHHDHDHHDHHHHDHHDHDHHDHHDHDHHDHDHIVPTPVEIFENDEPNGVEVNIVEAQSSAAIAPKEPPKKVEGQNKPKPYASVHPRPARRSPRGPPPEMGVGRGEMPPRGGHIAEEARMNHERLPREPSQPSLNDLDWSEEEAPATRRRLRRLAGKADFLPLPASKESHSETRDYIVQSVCKRVRLEPAQKICDEGVLSGKGCLIAVPVPPITVPGDITRKVAPPRQICPDDYKLLGRNDVCVYERTTTPDLFCPPETEDLGDRCVTYGPSSLTCDTGFALEEDTCVKAIHAPQLLEFSVRYACAGKQCNHQIPEPRNEGY